jgi:hypothetical protein
MAHKTKWAAERTSKMVAATTERPTVTVILVVV